MAKVSNLRVSDEGWHPTVNIFIEETWCFEGHIIIDTRFIWKHISQVNPISEAGKMWMPSSTEERYRSPAGLIASVSLM